MVIMLLHSTWSSYVKLIVDGLLHLFWSQVWRLKMELKKLERLDQEFEPSSFNSRNLIKTLPQTQGSKHSNAVCERPWHVCSMLSDRSFVLWLLWTSPGASTDSKSWWTGSIVAERAGVPARSKMDVQSLKTSPHVTLSHTFWCILFFVFDSEFVTKYHAGRAEKSRLIFFGQERTASSTLPKQDTWTHFIGGKVDRFPFAWKLHDRNYDLRVAFQNDLI